MEKLIHMYWEKNVHRNIQAKYEQSNSNIAKEISPLLPSNMLQYPLDDNEDKTDIYMYFRFFWFAT